MRWCFLLGPFWGCIKVAVGQRVTAAPFPSSSVTACVSVAAGTCLPSRYLCWIESGWNDWRESRLEKVRITTAESRETETAQHRRERLEENRMWIAETRQAVMRLNFNLEAFNYDRRAAETPQQPQTRLEQNRTRNAESRAPKTPQQRHFF
jgi:hypothetical protein